MLTFGSLFSGIGGLDLGLERAGMKCLWQVENEPYCNQVLAHHWPDVKRYGDICNVYTQDLEPVDVIAGGFPCQDISSAGKKAGLDGARSGLWSQFTRIIDGLQPRWIIVENVSAILGRGLGSVLRDLAALGFDAEWDVLPAGAFGVEHIRERVFVVAYPNGVGRAELLHGFTPTLATTLPRRKRQLASSDSHTALVEAVEQRCSESSLCRSTHGIPKIVDRLRGLGNAVVPQVAEFIGRAVVEAHKERAA